MGSEAIKTFDVNGGTIGRASRNDWILPEDTVSSQHALISFQDDHFFITDLSTNGVFIDNSKSPLGTGCTASLSNTQTLAIGLYQISIRVEGAQNSQSVQTLRSFDDTLPESFSAQDHSLLDDSPNDPLDLLGSSPERDVLSSNNSLPEDLFSEPHNSPLSQDQQTFENSPETSVADAFVAPNTHTETPNLSSSIPDNWDETHFSPSTKPSTENAQLIAEEPEDTEAFSQEALIPPTTSQLDNTQQTENLLAQSYEPEKPQQPPSQPQEKVSATGVSPKGPDNQQFTLTKESFIKNGLDTALLENSALVDQSLALLPFVLEGILATLRSRSEIKNELRASQTILQPVENNPLKFSVNLQDAFQNLLINQRPGFLSPEDSIKQAFQDLTQHEAALIMGIQTGLNAMLKKISPDAIETKIENIESKKNIFGKISSAKKWEYYKETYQHITENSSNSFIDMFGDDFVKGYEAYISNNKHYGR